MLAQGLGAEISAWGELAQAGTKEAVILDRDHRRGAGQGQGQQPRVLDVLDVDNLGSQIAQGL
jgi:hypothetical protein